MEISIRDKGKKERAKGEINTGMRKELKEIRGEEASSVNGILERKAKNREENMENNNAV